MTTHDPVNHPTHYTAHPSGVECITITEHMTFNVGNAIKYLWRADKKGGLEDLKKARWYVDREIARFEKTAPVAAPPASISIVTWCGGICEDGRSCTRPRSHEGLCYHV